MRDYKPFLLIERTLSQLRPAHWPFKGGWHKSSKRGIKLANRQRWERKARKLVAMQ
jgi:hypothetical protein